MNILLFLQSSSHLDVKAVFLPLAWGLFQTNYNWFRKNQLVNCSTEGEIWGVNFLEKFSDLWVLPFDAKKILLIFFFFEKALRIEVFESKALFRIHNEVQIGPKKFNFFAANSRAKPFLKQSTQSSNLLKKAREDLLKLLNSKLVWKTLIPKRINVSMELWNLTTRPRPTSSSAFWETNNTVMKPKNSKLTAWVLMIWRNSTETTRWSRNSVFTFKLFIFDSQEVHFFPCFWCHHQTNSQIVGSRFEQSRKVSFPPSPLWRHGHQGCWNWMLCQIPIEESVVPRCRCWKRCPNKRRTSIQH